MRDSTVRLIIQGAFGLVALVGIIVVGAFDSDAPVIRVLEFVLIAGVGYFFGHQGGKPNGIAAKNGD